jgi:hypothetical protein
MIGGFIIGQDNGRTIRVLVRGLGPSITSVPDPLQDPAIELRDANGALVTSNDNWKTNEAQVAATGLAPTDERESAVVSDLAPGNYTAILHASNSAPGVGLVEIYQL